MTITLRPEQERLVAEAIQSGAYETPDQVITRALEVLCSEGEALLDDNQFINDKLQRAFAQFERGEFFAAGQLPAEMARPKADWIRSRSPDGSI